MSRTTLSISPEEAKALLLSADPRLQDLAQRVDRQLAAQVHGSGSTEARAKARARADLDLVLRVLDGVIAEHEMVWAQAPHPKRSLHQLTLREYMVWAAERFRIARKTLDS